MYEDEFKIPQLQEGYVLVLRADSKNGRILNNDNTYYDDYQDPPDKGGKIYYHIYRSYDEAKNDILLTLKRSVSYEYIIYGHNGDELEHIIPKIENISLAEENNNFFIRLWKKLIGE